MTISVPHRRSERDAVAPSSAAAMPGVVNANGFISEVQTRPAVGRRKGDAFLEILDFLDIAAGSLLLEADELPAGLRSPTFPPGDVDAIKLGFVREVGDHVGVRRDIGEKGPPVV